MFTPTKILINFFSFIQSMKHDIIPHLAELEHDCLERGIPIIGSEKGEWLQGIVQKLKPKKILELGTANGYSGIILGSTGANVMTMEKEEALAEEAGCNFEQFKTKAEVIVGDAVKMVHDLAENKRNQGAFDLIFIDFAKSKYLNVLEDCITLVRKQGVIIADNITMPGCQNYTKAVLQHKKLKTQLIEIKDGLSYSEKIA